MSRVHIPYTKSASGFTLIELLIYMGIFSILLVFLMQMFGSILNTHAESQATSSISQDGNFILSRLTYDIHNAQSVSEPQPGELQVTGSTTYTYQKNGQNLEITNTSLNPPVTEQLNSSNTIIKSFTFSILGNPGGKNSVQILLTLQSAVLRSGAVHQMADFQTTIETR